MMVHFRSSLALALLCSYSPTCLGTVPDYQLKKRDRVNPHVSQNVKVVTKPKFDYPFR